MPWSSARAYGEDTDYSSGGLVGSDESVSVGATVSVFVADGTVELVAVANGELVAVGVAVGTDDMVAVQVGGTVDVLEAVGLRSGVTVGCVSVGNSKVPVTSGVGVALADCVGSSVGRAGAAASIRNSSIR